MTRTPKIIIGLDPGAGGGMAIFYPDGKKRTVSYKKEHSFSEELRDIREAAEIEGAELIAYVELLSGVSGGYKITGRQGFVMGTSYGKICGALEALKIPHYFVTPAKWQTGLGDLGKVYTERKRKLCTIAKQRFPQLNPTQQTSDAILIAEYGARLQ